MRSDTVARAWRFTEAPRGAGGESGHEAQPRQTLWRFVLNWVPVVMSLGVALAMLLLALRAG